MTPSPTKDAEQTDKTNGCFDTKKIVLIALLSSLALVVGVIESLLPLPLPGVKPGFANAFSLIALLIFGPSEALSVAAIRLSLSALISGNMFAFACSAGGLLCSLPIGILMYLRFFHLFSVRAISVASAVGFNVGQLAVVMAITGEPAVMLYLPILLLSALPAGFAVGLLAEKISSRLSQLTGFRR